VRRLAEPPALGTTIPSAAEITMGEFNITQEFTPEDLRTFVKYLLRDLAAMEEMLRLGLFESDVRRIGAEQELFLVDRQRRPAAKATDILATNKNPYLTPELARFNLEFNADPLLFSGPCLRSMEAALTETLTDVRREAAAHDTDVVMMGILPTLTKTDLTLDNMMPVPRYFALNDILTRMRGGDYEFRIKGTDELLIRHDSMMVEACNTSFQVHLQIDANDFAASYNVAQAIAAPVLAAATNSPLLFGKRLWRETRIALFEQSLDTRQPGHPDRFASPRVSFGTSWVKKEVLEIFQEDIARFRVLLGTVVKEDPFEALRDGRAPLLQALRLHNGTIYRWNRPCYGISEGRPHLRIECRVLPAGPTIVDEVANAAFWLGLMIGFRAEHGDPSRLMDFDDAKSNLIAASRLGLGAQFTWIGGEILTAQDLILKRLLPLARQGLDLVGVDAADCDKYLGILQERVATGRTGSQWVLSSFQAMKDAGGTRSERLTALVSATIDNQKVGQPVHTWPLANREHGGGWKQHYRHVDQYMQTDLFTVNRDEVVDLVASLMDWKHVRHVPVEDSQHRLIGLVSHRSLVRLLARGWFAGQNRPIAVGEIMETNPVTVSPETTTLEAIRLMRTNKITCLPVVRDGKLVGMVTERDLVQIAAPLLEQALSE
jgi:CBS domain-containing protein/gamma-glutamylcysteine synthetase